MRPERPDGPELTFWAEEHATEAELLELLEHKDAVMREGAIYGLTRIGLPRHVRDALSRTAETDASPTIRAIAKEALE